MEAFEEKRVLIVDNSAEALQTLQGVLVDQAKRWNADLVILGSHGRKGMEHFLMGSVSEAVARYAPCSVYIVRIPAQAPANLSDERLTDVGEPGGTTQTPTVMQPQRRTRVCNVCGKPYSSNICPTCADRIRAEAIARKKRKDRRRVRFI